MNETKVNTKIGDVASPELKKILLTLKCIGAIKTPYGAHYINRGDALDHAHMRGKQLTSLLTLMSGEGLANFRLLNEGAQDSLLWLAQQLSKETEAMFDMILADEAGGSQ